MFHDPAPQSQTKDLAAGRKATYGIWLFVVYLLVYAGFVGINLLRPQWMGASALAGLNLAVVYGFGLILLAIGLGLVYNRQCTAMEDSMNRDDQKGGRA